MLASLTELFQKDAFNVVNEHTFNNSKNRH